MHAAHLRNGASGKREAESDFRNGTFVCTASCVGRRNVGLSSQNGTSSMKTVLLNGVHRLHEQAGIMCRRHRASNYI